MVRCTEVDVIAGDLDGPLPVLLQLDQGAIRHRVAGVQLTLGPGGPAIDCVTGGAALGQERHLSCGS